MFIEYSKEDNTAIAPTKGTPYSAGLDLYLPNDWFISPNTSASVNTKICFKIPHGHYARILEKSSNYNCFSVKAGVIDEDYRGPIYIAVHNYKHVTLALKKGQALAQIVFQPYLNVMPMRVKHISKETPRGTGCFGSTSKTQTDDNELTPAEVETFFTMKMEDCCC